MADRYYPPPYRSETSYDRGAYHERREQYNRNVRSDYYEPQYQYPRSPPRDPRPYVSQGSGSYNFRGAAQRDPYPAQRAEEQFTFTAGGPPAPHFPSARPLAPTNTIDSHFPPGRGVNHSSAPQSLPSHHSLPPRPQMRHAGNGDRGALNGDRSGPRRDYPPRGRSGRGGRRGFARFTAHDRDIFKHRRASTPEQMEGMNVEGTTHFAEVISSDEDEEKTDRTNGFISLTGNSEGESDGQGPRKRARIESPVAEVQRPKWSNADPYTALPPVESIGPKKDIVKIIRKARMDTAPQTDAQNAVKNNVDFISFDDALDGNASSSESFSVDIIDSPRVSHSTRRKRNAAARKAANGVNGTTTRTPSSSPPPPPPPDGLTIPTDEEIALHLAEHANATGKKRKREEQSTTIGDLLPEWEAAAWDSIPWRISHSRSTGNANERLHNEIRDFYEFVKPEEYEGAVRRDIIARVQQVVSTCSSINTAGKMTEIKCFGSFAAGLYLPVADMDLVAVSPRFMSTGSKVIGQRPNQMRTLGGYITSAGLAAPNSLICITRARVPLVKFTDSVTGIKVDISFENDSGLIANRTLQDWKAQYPAMPVIVAVIKQLLAMRGLNEVFTGGLGGFSIVCLVVSMLQLMPEVQSGSMNPEQHYDHLLMHFLDLYGDKLDIRNTGIMLDPPGYYNKMQQGGRASDLDKLTIIDPNNACNDLSGGSRRINEVLDVFRGARSMLQRRIDKVSRGEDVQESMLGCILGGNYASFRQQRERLAEVHRDMVQGRLDRGRNGEFAGRGRNGRRGY